MKEKRALQPTAEQLRALPGKYEVAGAGDFTIRRAGDGLVVELTSDSSEPIYAGPGNSWFILSRDLEMQFEGTGNGRIVGNGVDMPFTRTK